MGRVKGYINNSTTVYSHELIWYTISINEVSNMGTFIRPGELESLQYYHFMWEDQEEGIEEYAEGGNYVEVRSDKEYLEKSDRTNKEEVSEDE